MENRTADVTISRLMVRVRSTSCEEVSKGYRDSIEARRKVTSFPRNEQLCRKQLGIFDEFTAWLTKQYGKLSIPPVFPI